MRKILLTFLVVSVIIGQSMAQQNISGQILDEEGLPIIGANLLIEEDGIHKGGTATDPDGNYALTLKQEQDIKITYLGYETLWMTLEDLLLNPVLTLKVDAYNLESVIVTAHSIKRSGCKMICCYPISESEQRVFPIIVEMNSIAQWNYFPNPTTNQIKITVDQELEGIVEVMDMQGRSLQQLKVDQWPFSLNLAQFPAGTYVLRLHNEDRTELIGQVVKID